MELQFQNKAYSCLDVCLQEVQNGEETLEIRLPEGMPDIGSILAAWGQPVLRTKEWRNDRIFFSGGMMVWVLYAPEDGSTPQCLEGWIPYQMGWDLQTGGREGLLRLQLGVRFVDARSVSPRKIMVRSGMSVQAEATAPNQYPLYQPESENPSVEYLLKTYPVCVRKEGGEKNFQITEELKLPSTAPQPEKILYYTVHPEVTDQKVVTNRAVFRGNGNLHILYQAEGGQYHNWDFPLAFSQFTDLDEQYALDAAVNVRLCPTNLELELDEENCIHLKCGLSAQYMVFATELLQVASDAYSPGRAVTLNTQTLSLPVILDTVQDTLSGEHTISGKANAVIDTQLLVDCPNLRRSEENLQLHYPCSLQILYYGEDGTLRSGSGRFETEYCLRSDRNTQIWSTSAMPPEPRVAAGTDGMNVHWEFPATVDFLGSSEIPMVMGLRLGDADPSGNSRPSLILKRAGKNGLWEVAKETGSRMEDIKTANGLEAEPVPGQMLLIPLK